VCRSILVIGADTVIECDGQIMGKPVDATDAAAMLTRLSGRGHSVLTGVSVILARHGQWATATGVDESRLTFRTLSADEIQRYVASGEPLDKAGSYAIQGAGAAFVQVLNGSHSNVVGVPLRLLRELARQVGVDLPDISGELNRP
jgi:septum formation protein